MVVRSSHRPAPVAPGSGARPSEPRELISQGGLAWMFLARLAYRSVDMVSS